MTELEVIKQSLIQYILKLKTNNPQDPKIEQARAVLYNIRKGR